MTNIIGKKNWYFIFSLILIIPGIISLIFFGLNLSIDYTGGARLTFLFPKSISQKTEQDIRMVMSDSKIHVVSIQTSDKRLILRTPTISQKQNNEIILKIHKKVGDFKEEEFEIVGPVIC